MRRCDEPIEVRQERELPSLFLWRNRLWRVLDVQTRWVESGSWWDSPAVRAARGDEGWHSTPPGGAPDDASDLVCEQEVWRVEAANGEHFSRGVYELAHATADGTWRLRAVLD